MEYTAMFTIFLIEKYHKISTGQPFRGTFVLVFHAQYQRFWEHWFKEILSCYPWESIETVVLFYGHH